MSFLIKFATLVVVFIGFVAPVFAVEPVRDGSERAAWDALRQGNIVLFRHALAPGGGDPPGFKLSDCATQRNLSEEGKAQAARMGARLKSEGVKVDAVWSSQWCRTLETAKLMALVPEAKVQPQPNFNSLFATPERQPTQSAAAKRQLANYKAGGALVIVTHQVAITGLTGIVPASGEGVVIRIRPTKPEPTIEVLGRVMP